MIIYFEGLSCAGKTTLLDNLYKHFRDKEPLENDVICVNEIYNLSKDYNVGANIGNGYVTKDDCLKSDEMKSQAAKRAKEKLVLVDRGYASTLAYNYTNLMLGKDKNFSQIEDWYKEGILTGKLIKPNIYVYIEISPEKSIERARAAHRFTDRYAWYTGPEFAVQYYEHFFSKIENNIPIIRVNGDQSIEGVLNETISKLRKYFP